MHIALVLSLTIGACPKPIRPGSKTRQCFSHRPIMYCTSPARYRIDAHKETMHSKTLQTHQMPLNWRFGVTMISSNARTSAAYNSISFAALKSFAKMEA
eukprot:4460727-Amphidinium_carterae.1